MFLYFIPLHIAVLIILMRLFARKEADLDLPKCAVIFGLTALVLDMAGNALDLWAIPLYFLLPFAILGTLFSVPWAKAAAIAGSFLVYLIVFGLLIDTFSR